MSIICAISTLIVNNVGFYFLTTDLLWYLDPMMVYSYCLSRLSVHLFSCLFVLLFTPQFFSYVIGMYARVVCLSF